MLNKLQSTPDGDGPLPNVLAGGASGRLKGGRHTWNAKESI